MTAVQTELWSMALQVSVTVKLNMLMLKHWQI